MKTFEELQIGKCFRIPGTNARYVYRKASNSHCTLGAALQPIRNATQVIPLTSRETADYFADKFTAKLDFLKSLQQK
jgi:hypothetical protein